MWRAVETVLGENVTEVRRRAIDVGCAVEGP